MKGIIISISLLLSISLCFAQKKITILGSSTAAGNGASVYDSAWVGRLQAYFRKNNADGLDTVINNRAVAGYVTYKSLPTGYPTPLNRPVPDPAANVTYVLNDFPRADIVIINYPTNDIVSGYEPEEMMDNLRLMFQQFNASGIACFITTSQPRNTATDLQRTVLRQVVDSIQNNFGLYAIDFWDDLVTSDGTNMLRPDLTPDGTHPNDTGHGFLFQRVVTRNIFASISGPPLPLTLKVWEVKLEKNSVQLNWSMLHEEPNTSFEIERSDDAKTFQTVYRRNGTGRDASYSWSDALPLNGRSFYRLKIDVHGQIIYSRTILINNNSNQLVTGLYVDASQLHLQLYSTMNQQVVLSIIDNAGDVVKKQSFRISGATTGITIPVSELSSGEYFVRITTSDGLNTTERFSFLK